MEAGLAQWVAEIEPVLAKRLAAAGLIPKLEAKAAATLGAFITEYIATRTDIKPATRAHLERAKRDLVAFFGDGRELTSITPGDADKFRLQLRLGDNTVRRICGRAKQLFRAAVRNRLIASNPFEDMKDCNVRANRERDFFVTREMAARVLEACPDAQCRTAVCTISGSVACTVRLSTWHCGGATSIGNAAG